MKAKKSKPELRLGRQHYRGRQHPAHAESLDRMAEDLTALAGTLPITNRTMAGVFKREAARFRKIVR